MKPDSGTAKVFEGMNEVYKKIDTEVFQGAPNCHLTKMEFHMGEEESWWECKHCGHVKTVEEATKIYYANHT